MKSRSLIAAAADLESLRTQWAGFRPDLVFCFCAPDIDLGRHAAARVSAAEQVLAGSGAQAAVLLVSCVGRREVLGDEIDDEIEAVRRVFPAGTPIAGFYSYGEIGPHGDDRLSELHNQSITIASFSEV
jgi:hypothetical protein